mmetsp:Transcript_11890/g.25080  ORF Transcript_11890/g.25080 Transcript_11890/m.25080 type:complete len:89 (+) Transcript_11890:52-318(+)
MSAFLRSCLLGVRVPLPAIRVSLPATWDAPGLRPLNSSQADAVKHALTHPLTLVQGPPGTGKTARDCRFSGLSLCQPRPWTCPCLRCF